MEEFNNLEQPQQEVAPEIIEEVAEEVNNPVIEQPPLAPQYNPINFTPVNPILEKAPISRGLKVFSLIMAAVILLTSASLTGYFFGKGKSQSGSFNNDVKIALADKPTKTDEMTAVQVYAKVNPSVVGIKIYNNSGIGAQASGIFYSEDGYIVTNDHIYADIGAAQFKVITYDGKEYDAEYVAGDKISDLAVLKIKSGKFKVAEFGNSNQLVNGQNVVAIGRPDGADNQSTITKGIISATARRVTTTTNYSAKLIQTDSAINPGSSGGALVNMYGQVVGVTSSKLAGDVYDAVGYAIPTTTMKRIVEELIKHKKVVSRAKLGITYTAIDSIAAKLGGYKYEGLYVASVAEDSDLYGKVTKEEIITHINGIKVTRDEIVLDIIEASKAGDVVEITCVTKNGTTKIVKAILKANVGESSYNLNEAPKKEQNSNNNNGNNNGGGIFDFPFGE